MPDEEKKNRAVTQAKTDGGDSSECSLHIPKTAKIKLPISALRVEMRNSFQKSCRKV